MTLFLSEPDEYDGGELVVEDLYGSHEIKLPAGDLVLYPASSLHLVTPVTRGMRVASFFWLQSMVRDAHARSLIFDLDTAIQALVERWGEMTRNGQIDRHLSQPYPLLGRSMMNMSLFSRDGICNGLRAGDATACRRRPLPSRKWRLPYQRFRGGLLQRNRLPRRLPRPRRHRHLRLPRRRLYHH